jgi:hypothetical protein
VIRYSEEWRVGKGSFLGTFVNRGFLILNGMGELGGGLVVEAAESVVGR